MTNHGNEPIGEFSRGNCVDMQPRFVGGPLHNQFPRLPRLWKRVVAIESPPGVVIVPSHQASNWYEYELHEYQLVEWTLSPKRIKAPPGSPWYRETVWEHALGVVRSIEYLLAGLPTDRMCDRVPAGFHVDVQELLTVGMLHTGGHVAKWQF